MKRRGLGERIRYWFDYVMSRGPIAMTVLLFSIMAVTVLVIGIVAFFVADEGSLLSQLWISLMHTLDTGALGENATDNIPYLILMSLATLCGLFITSILIGVIATGVENKLADLRKGSSVVQEQLHTVIIGFDHNTYDILQELVEANRNQKHSCIVILGQQPKDEMEDAIAARLPDTGRTRIICRSGSLHEAYSLERCAVEQSRAVILNTNDDAETVKVLLALATYIKGKTLTNTQLRFVASIQDKQYMETAMIAGEGRAEIVYAKDAIARIIANTCRQHGLSQVLTELFNFAGNELYFESVPGLTGKTMKEAMLCFSDAIVVGLCANETVRLNPPMDTLIGENDQVVLLERDDGAYTFHEPKAVEDKHIVEKRSSTADMCEHLVVLGSNDKLPLLLQEYNQYVRTGAQVVVVDDDIEESALPAYENLTVSVVKKLIDRKLLEGLLKEQVNNILLLNDDSTDPEHSDSQTLMRLIMLRDIADKTNCHFAITTEMRSTDNRRLAAQVRVDDFVIGSNFTSLLMAQIAENHLIAPMITDLLDEDGSELYMKPAADYVAIGEAVDGYVLAESAARKGEIFVGYRHMTEAKSNVVVNPDKRQQVIFEKDDQLVVIAEC